jgi:2-polyprenyl-6-methoxyphenol hydroxylase-like FAD-dependent oxidoreductase
MQATTGTRVLIIGAGIGGLSAAIALRRAGIEATVFERAGSLQKIQVGGAYSMWLGGMLALQELGLVEPVQAVGGPLERFEYWSSRGRELAAWSIGERGRQKFGLAPVGIMRADLHRVLADALDDGVVQYGAAYTGFEQDGSGVTARFADGREERGDLLIGADGINSLTREQLIGRTPLHYPGYGHWYGFVDLEHELTPLGTFRVVYGEGSRFAFLPISRERLCWWCTLKSSRGGRDADEGRKARLLEHFRGWTAPVEAVIEATDEAVIARRDTFDRRPVKRWGAGRVTLLGDAAHPMTFNVGQGAGSALKDGVMLAKYLTAGRDTVAALRA